MITPEGNNTRLTPLAILPVAQVFIKTPANLQTLHIFHSKANPLLASPHLHIVIVPKKSAPGEPPKRRLCVDFRKVNVLQQEVITAGKTKGQISIHPLPKIDEMYVKLKGAKVFSTIDLRSRYHHITLGKSSRAKTAFVTPFGKYKFLMVPFGLAQTPAYFQLLMNKVLHGLELAIMYLDDIIIFSKNELQHLEHLETVSVT